MSIPPYGTGRHDLTRLDEQRAAAPETTPGQAAYEAYARKVVELDPDTRAYPDWDTRTNVQMFAWSAAAKAGHAAIAAQERPAPGARDALRDALRDAAGRIKRCTSAKAACTFCEADLAAVMEAADAYARSAPELAADPTADDLAIASLTDERDGYRAALAQVASMAEAKGAVRQVSNIAKVARNALEGK